MATYNNIKKLKIGDNIFNLYDSGNSGGTVTSIGVSNATNGGLTVSGGPVTSSGTITIGHSNVLSSAQTTQAVYPIKIDKNGHISAYGSAVTIPTVPSNIVNTITTTAGAHTAISSQKGNVSFNVPTKTSHLTNDSGFITTDTNTTYALSGALSSHKFTSTLTAGGSGSGTSTSDFTLAAGTGITITDDASNRKMTIACSVTNTDTKVSTNLAIDSQIYYPVLGTDTTNASTKNYDKGFMYLTESGTTSDIGEASLTLGNSTASGTTGNKKGTLTLYGSSAYGVILESGAPTAIRTITLPDNSGTIILDTDVLDTSNRDDLFEGRLITGVQYSYIPRFKSYTAYYDARINPPATSATATLPYQGFGKTQIIDIISWDVITGEKVIVDWSPSTHEIASGNMTINISISSSYSHAINCLILYRQVFGM